MPTHGPSAVGKSPLQGHSARGSLRLDTAVTLVTKSGECSERQSSTVESHTSALSPAAYVTSGSHYPL
jgi:hypothetical protein